MINTKKLQIVFKKMYPLTIALMIFMRSQAPAHERSNFLIRSSARAHERFFDERAHGKKVCERSHMSAITLTRSNDQHL
jgi:hypothetical protein